MGESGDSPLPSSVKVLLEPALVPCQPQDTPSLLLCWSVLATLLGPVTLSFQPLLCPQEPSLPPTPLERRIYITDSPSVLRLNWSCLGDLETVNAAPRKASEVVRDPGSARGEDSQETSLPPEVDSCLPPYHVLQMDNFPSR